MVSDSCIRLTLLLLSSVDAYSVSDKDTDSKLLVNYLVPIIIYIIVVIIIIFTGLIIIIYHGNIS